VKILAFDSIGGAAGDMILASLLDLGIDVNELEQDLRSLGAGEFRIRAERGISAHLAALRVHVETRERELHGRLHEEAHAGDHAPHRGLREIEALIEASGLPPPVRAQSIRVFRRIAEVEARMHQIPVEQIHFHEIGAVDSIVDIVGSCLALYRVGVDAVAVGPLPQGRGSIACAHGVFPNPAPATLELLRGMQIEPTDLPFELVTPTGAALLAEWRSIDRAPAGATILRVGYGMGQRDLGARPNVLRATLLETGSAVNADDCLVMETNLDDVTPELVGVLSQRLLEAGALDVFTLPAHMKKQRPGILLTVLCRSENRERLLDLIFRESTTFGVREYSVRRTTLSRRSVAVKTQYGMVSVKIGEWKGEPLIRAPEIEDCIRLAREHNVSVRAVYEAAQEASRAQ
jgi:uncharacterized protein (TIGR00299 family) protein